VKAGAKVRLPLVGREIPIVADAYSDPEKGSGAVKITPAHDLNDFEVGKRHKLELINIFTRPPNSMMRCPRIIGARDRFAARKLVIADMEAAACSRGSSRPRTRAACPARQRADRVLADRPVVRERGGAAKQAIAKVEDGSTRFVPQNWEKTYFEWMRNIQPVDHLAPAVVGTSDPGVVRAGWQGLRYA
jgi:valyl-tRNA synthetase